MYSTEFLLKGVHLSLELRNRVGHVGKSIPEYCRLEIGDWKSYPLVKLLTSLTNQGLTRKEILKIGRLLCISNPKSELEIGRAVCDRQSCRKLQECRRSQKL